MILFLFFCSWLSPRRVVSPKVFVFAFRFFFVVLPFSPSFFSGTKGQFPILILLIEIIYKHCQTHFTRKVVNSFRGT